MRRKRSCSEQGCSWVHGWALPSLECPPTGAASCARGQTAWRTVAFFTVSQ